MWLHYPSDLSSHQPPPSGIFSLVIFISLLFLKLSGMLLSVGNCTCYSSIWSIFPSEISLVFSLLQFLHIISVKPSLSAQYKISMPLSQYFIFPFFLFFKYFLHSLFYILPFSIVYLFILLIVYTLAIESRDSVCLPITSSSAPGTVFSTYWVLTKYLLNE